jgi:hypothetical protein
MANSSATASGAWLVSTMPPDPTRMRSVVAAICAISTAGVELALAAVRWCSATQNRW